MAEPVTPIRPGVEITEYRPRELISFLAESIENFHKATGQIPTSIAFVLHSDDGKFDHAFMGDGWSSQMLALSGAVLTRAALEDTDDDELEPDAG